MTPKDEATETRLIRKLRELSQLIATAEVKAVIPPSNCSDIPLYVSIQKDRVKALQKEAQSVGRSLDDFYESVRPTPQLSLF